MTDMWYEHLLFINLYMLTLTSLDFHGGGGLTSAPSIWVFLSNFWKSQNIRLKISYVLQNKKLQCSYSIEINKLIQPTVYWVMFWLSNLTMGSSNRTRGWPCCSGCKACTAKLHHASDITSIVSGWACVGLGLKSESMKLGSESCCYFPDNMQQDWEIELNIANYIEISSILLKYTSNSPSLPLCMVHVLI